MVWVILSCVLVSACIKNLKCTYRFLPVALESDGPGIRSASIFILSFLKQLHHSTHKLSNLKSFSKGLLVRLNLLN